MKSSVAGYALLLIVLLPVIAIAQTVQTYSDIREVEESGDVVGTELTLHVSGEAATGTLRHYEGMEPEPHMVGEGQMSEEQYWARRRSEGYGGMIGAAGALGWAGGARLLTMGYSAYQAWRAASVAGATLEAVDQISAKDGQIMRVAMQAAQAGKNTFMNNFSALADAVRQVIGPTGRLTPIGKIGDQVVYGSARSGIGLADINGKTYVVRIVRDTYEVLGPFRTR
ncbi:MAG TPA: hypothetical protein VGF48_20075 [Thermoanaerobaculia bacterium]|jgi:hypothetical protein